MIQIRNVPDPLHRTLKARAALEGRTLSDFLLRAIEQMAQRPTEREIRARLAEREPVDLGMPAADAVRAERDRR
ncbi:MAG: DUF1778 domain-containing protein [Acidobacteriota bacterium]